MTIIPTSSALHIIRKIEQKTKSKIILPRKNRDNKTSFPDGEVYAALPNVDKSENHLVVHCGMPNSNDGIMELKIILGILKNQKVKSVEVLFTYFPYGMQDDIFDPGEINVAESLIKELTKYYRVKKIYTVDAHFFGKKWVKKYPLINISTFKTIGKAVAKKYPKIVFLAPDSGCQIRTGLKGVSKKRINSHKIELKDTNFLKNQVNNKVVGVVDDIIETGGTMERFALECRKNGAKKLIAVITHGVLSKGIKRIKRVYDGLYMTNSIKRSESNVDITELIIEKLNL